MRQRQIEGKQIPILEGLKKDFDYVQKNFETLPYSFQ